MVSARTNMPKSVTHRMLAALVETGFVRQTGSRDYQLTIKLTTLGFRFVGQTGLLEHCQAPLDALADEVRELVRMTVVDGERPVWIAKAQGASGSLIMDPVMGREVALHATATGKVWLASLPQERALELVLRRGFGTPEDHGPHVIQSVDELLAELRATLEPGYGLAWGEADPGVAAVAVGIRSPTRADRQLLGTVSIAGPVFRLPKERLVGWVPRLQATADELSALGSMLGFWRQARNAATAGTIAVARPSSQGARSRPTTAP